MSAHELSTGASDEYYTPRYVFDALGVRFDLDVAAPTDKRHLHVPTGRYLTAAYDNPKWDGFVWMNPPFGGRNGLVPWLDKFVAHGDGVALTPDRTSAPWWQRYIHDADEVLFVREKIKFHRADGSIAKQPGTGTTLWACGSKGIAALKNAERAGLGVRMRVA